MKPTIAAPVLGVLLAAAVAAASAQPNAQSGGQPANGFRRLAHLRAGAQAPQPAGTAAGGGSVLMIDAAHLPQKGRAGPRAGGAAPMRKPHPPIQPLSAGELSSRLASNPAALPFKRLGSNRRDVLTTQHPLGNVASLDFIANADQVDISGDTDIWAARGVAVQFNPPAFGKAVLVDVATLGGGGTLQVAYCAGNPNNCPVVGTAASINNHALIAVQVGQAGGAFNPSIQLSDVAGGKIFVNSITVTVSNP